MKTNPFNTLAGAFTAIMITPAFAIEAPVDDSPPPAAANNQPAENKQPEKDEAKPAAEAQVAYLGVVSNDIPQMLAEHLGIKPGEGIIVSAIMPDGPAAKAGIAVHDIISRVAGQAVGSSLDLTKKVAARKPGETLRIDVIHKGKPVGIDVTLGTRPAGFAGLNQRPLDQLNLDGMPKDMADRLRGMIGGMEFNIEGGVLEIDRAQQDMQKRMKKAMDDLKAPDGQGLGEFRVQSGATIRMMDDQGSVELKSNDGGKEVTVRDKDNKIIWTGPWDTEQDKAAAPQDIRQRIDRLNLDTTFQGKGLRLRMGGPINPNNDGE